jgi:hypothetical protein
MTANTPAIFSTKSTKAARYASYAALVLVLCLVSASAFAFQSGDAASIIKAKTDQTYNLAYTAVYGLMGTALIATFLGALFGKMEWMRFAQCCVGIVGVSMITVLIQTFS